MHMHLFSGIQQSAALALGRLANYSEQLAEAVVANEVLPQLVFSLDQQNVMLLFFTLSPAIHAACFPSFTIASVVCVVCVSAFLQACCSVCSSAVAKHSPELAQAVVDAGSLAPLTHCLSEFEPSVKEAAAWALGYISRHTPGLNFSCLLSVPLACACSTFSPHTFLSIRKVKARAQEWESSRTMHPQERRDAQESWQTANGFTFLLEVLLLVALP